jgi:iron(III) transport system substrate-binding protein
MLVGAAVRHLRSAVLSLGIAAFLLPMLAACGDENQSGDKKIIVYSGRSESLVKPALDKFAAASGIEVEARYGDTAQMVAQLIEEGDKTRADVFIAQDAGGLGTVAKAGLFGNLPEDVLAKVPAAYRARSGQWVGVTGRARTLVYHPDLLPAAELPASVFELTEPKWRGKIGVAPTNASFQAFVTSLRVGSGEDRATQFIADLKANDPQIRENNVQIVQDVSDGKLPAGLVNHYYLYEIAKEKGVAPESLPAKLHFFAPGDPGNLVNVSGAGLLTRSTEDPDSRALVEYLLGTEAQTYFATEVFEYPLVAGVSTAPGVPEFSSLKPPAIDLNDLDSLEQTVTLIKSAGLA